MNEQGKLLHDIFLYPFITTTTTSTEPSFLIDHHHQHSILLRPYLQRHILRSKVKLAKQVEPNRSIYSAWKNPSATTTTKSTLAAEEWLNQNSIGVDPRLPELGYRWQSEDSVPSRKFVHSHVTFNIGLTVNGKMKQLRVNYFNRSN
jgi:folate-binding Fe-S cluster repair protein YgfZ